jgi:hypothetical protein
MSFYLVRLEPDPSEPGKCFDVPIPDHGPFDKGSDAARVAKLLTDQFGFKVQPRRMSQAADWRERQAKRLADGTLTPLPKKWDLPPIKDHFAHLDEAKHQGMVCFTENDQLGIIDRVTVLTPGRYISRFYETDGKMDDDKRRKLIAAIDPTGELLFAWKPEEIERVYKEGPSSCMDGTHNFPGVPCWPPAVYGAGDLACAYTVNNKGRIQSRCMVWPEKKLYGRIYGDVQRMIKLLESEGYENDRDEDHTADGNGHHFDGARLLKVAMKDKGYVVMPYLDDIGVCIDGGEHWIAAERQPDVEDEEHPDMCFSGSTIGYTRVMRWCPKTKEYHHVISFVQVQGVDQQWSKRAVDIYGFMCEETRAYWPKDQRMTLGDGTFVCQKWFEEHGTICEATGHNIRKSDVVEFEGKKVSRSYKRQIERERQDAEWRAQRTATMQRSRRFYEAVQPMLDPSVVNDATMYRPAEPRYVRDYDYERMSTMELRDLMMARYIEPRITVAIDPAAPIEQQQQQAYEMVPTVDGRLVARRVA